MPRWLGLFFVLICIGLTPGPVAAADQPITIENSELRVTLTPANATLQSVTRRQTGASALGTVLDTWSRSGKAGEILSVIARWGGWTGKI